MSKISIETDEPNIKDLFYLLELLNEFFHQPARYSEPDIAKAFAFKHYRQIKHFYYDVVWNWLPKEMREQIEQGE